MFELRKPDNEQERLIALQELEILDTLPEERFSRITRIAKTVFNVDIATISFIDAERQWFKGMQGLDACETSRNVSFCGHAILNDDVLVISDATQDKRFSENPFVTGDPNIRFYAGMPITGPRNHKVGTLCVIDRKPRQFSEADKQLLKDLASWVEIELNSKKMIMAIQELIKSEERIQQLSGYQKAILDNAGFAIITSDIIGNIISFNPAAEHMLGYSAEEMINKSPATFHDPQEVQQRAVEFTLELNEKIDPGFDVFVAKALRNLPNVHEWTYIRKDGSRFPVLLSVTALKDKHGDVFGFLGLASDISKLKQIEAQIRESEEKFKSIILYSAIGIALVSLDGKWLKVNDAVCKILGYSEEELLKIDFQRITHHEDLKIDLKHVGQLLHGKIDHYHMEKRYIHKEGYLVWVLLSVSMVRDSNANPLYFIAQIQNITERKNAQALLELQRFELARSNKELEQFAYVASHDLQEPLRMVASFCQLLEKKYNDQIDTKGKEYIHFAVDGAKRMQALVDALLSYAKVGKKDVEINPVDLNQIIRTIKHDLDAKIKENSATISAEHLPVIMANDIQMHQLFQNLITNALKFKSDRPPVIEIKAQKIKKGWEFSVSDNGIGIEEQFFLKMFVIFQRLHERGKYPGTGIGLALCKKIVENFGGKISVASTVGVGTTFHFTLNVAEA